MKTLRAYKGSYDLVVERYSRSYATPLTESEFVKLMPNRDEDVFVDGVFMWFI